MEKISIIITTYKRSNLIEKALKSVINQTYKNLEIIVVDDNAEFPEERKKTECIVKKYKNIKLIQNKKNFGAALSRNKGIYHATGKFIAFLDDDDEYLPQKIEKQYFLFKKLKKEKKNPGLIFCNVYGVSSEKSRSVNYEMNVLYQQMMECLCPTSFWFTSKEIMKKIGFFSPASSKEDSIVLLKILINKYNIYKVDEGLIIFNEHHSDDGMSGYKISNINGVKEYRSWCRKYYHKLDNQKQINEVEMNFSKELISYLVINDMMKEAKKELKNIAKRKLFSKYFIKSILKIIFKKMYLKKINIYNSSLSLKKMYTDFFYYFNRFKKYDILSDKETIKKIICEKKSISRFGDGEFKWILDIKQNSFQSNNEILRRKLLEILNEKNENLLICIPVGLKDVSANTSESAYFWKNFVRWYQKPLKQILNKQYKYGNASFTRWYIDYFNNDLSFFKQKLDNIKKIWDNKSIIIVEGAGTKIGVGNDLLDNAKSIKRIIAPSVNAFDYYEEIYNYIIDNVSKENLIILSLGPTATILASALTKKNFEFLDLGHIDIEYEWYKMGTKKKCPVPGKSVNEVGIVENNYFKNTNKKYLNSIIKFIGIKNEN